MAKLGCSERKLATEITLHEARVETLPPLGADIVTARAFAPLARLLDLAAGQIEAPTVFLLLKGQDIDNELTAATKSWKMRIERYPSLSDPHGTVLRLSEVRRA